MKYFTSDWHLGHKNILKYSNRPFENIDEMDNAIFRMVMETTKPGDEIYLLGDMGSLDAIKRFFEKFPKDRGFHWIEGNHDKNYACQFKKRLASISTLKDVKIDGVHTILCHYPMLTWNRSHYNNWHLFGHHHIGGHGSEGIAQRTVGKMLNVNLEFNNYKMYSEKDIRRIMERKEDNWDYIPTGRDPDQKVKLHRWEGI